MKIGLSGGIAAGKSTASARFKQLGAVVIDYDALSRDAVLPGSPVLSQIAEVFGPEFIDDGGVLNRELMGQRIFSDPNSRKTLENLIHPEVFRLATDIESEAIKANPNGIVIHDIPLLVEKNLAPQFDAVVIVDTDTELRERRLVDTRGLPPAEARARIAAGATDAQRHAVGTYFLDGNGTAENLAAQVTELFANLQRSEL